MIIAIISDTHDELRSIPAIGRVIREKKCSAVIHCGDIVEPYALTEMASWGVPVHFVFGNNETDHGALRRIAAAQPGWVCNDEQADVMLGGVRFGVTHYPDVAERLAASGAYDVVCHGHTHIARQVQIGATLLLNPGTAGGKRQSASMMVLDTEGMRAEEVRLVFWPPASGEGYFWQQK